MKPRSISTIAYAAIYDMGGLQVRQPLPSPAIEYLDPFVLLHHGHVVLPEDTELKTAGVGPHPHRGFSPVTFVFKGGSRHLDSRSNDQAVYAGGTQWMHAGMGIVHSERPLEHEMEIIQMWVNSPAKNKMDIPFYFPLSKENTPQYVSEDKLVTVQIITGDLLGIKGPIPTLTAINAATLTIAAGGKVSIPLPSSHHTLLYLLDGRIKVNEQKEVEGFNMVVFAKDGKGIEIEALENTRALLMSGEPIGEKIVAQGPFVMNTETEIMEAMRDYRMGKMGILIED